MDEKRLAEIEALARGDDCVRSEHALELVAEVRRLRGLVADARSLLGLAFMRATEPAK